jgi:hypothetical protein
MTVELITQQIEGCYAPLGNSGNILATCKQEVTMSSTAKQIDIYLAETGKLVGIIFTNDADSCHVPAHCLENAPSLSKFTGGIAVVNPSGQLKPGGKWEGQTGRNGGDLPLGVSLYHELGHAMQNVQTPEWYDEMTKKFLYSGSPKDKKFVQLEIEHQNMAQHEIPICRELGLPYRMKYTD